MTWLEAAGWCFSMLGFGWHVRRCLRPVDRSVHVTKVTPPVPFTLAVKWDGLGDTVVVTANGTLPTENEELEKKTALEAIDRMRESVVRHGIR
jgi:hypothetical protein